MHNIYSELPEEKGGVSIRKKNLSNIFLFISFFYSNASLFCVFLSMRRFCKEGLGVGLQAKYRHIRHPNRGRSAKDKYYADDDGKYEKSFF